VVRAAASRKNAGNGAQNHARDDAKLTHEAESLSWSRYSMSSRLSRDFRRIRYSTIRTTSTPSRTYVVVFISHRSYRTTFSISAR
jgi:hypothetical protein